MNIKEVEQLTGLRKANIRYYEQEGLLTPARNENNNYREYGEEDVKTLKKIQTLRVLGVPLSEIKRFQKGRTTLDVLMGRRARELEEEITKMEEIKNVLRTMGDSRVSFLEMDVSVLDMRMSFFHMKGEKVMRVDKIYRLEKYESIFEKTWKILFLAYYPLYWALGIAYDYELPNWVQAAFLIPALLSVLMIGIIRYRISWSLGRRGNLPSEE